MSLKHVPVYSSFAESLGERTGRDRDGRKQVNHFSKWLSGWLSQPSGILEPVLDTGWTLNAWHYLDPAIL